MKNLFLINEDEAKRILNMHSSKGYKTLLNEQSNLDVNKVMEIQTLLKNKGYGSYLGTTGNNEDGVDGDFGTKTLEAVLNFLKSGAATSTVTVAGTSGVAAGTSGVSTTTGTPAGTSGVAAGTSGVSTTTGTPAATTTTGTPAGTSGVATTTGTPAATTTTGGQGNNSVIISSGESLD